MRLEILQVPDCPNVALLEERLDQALADHQPRVEPTYRIIEDLEAAAAAGMSGSPTLLIDGALRTWRGRASPADPAERATHQAILRAFATTGAPPEATELDRVARDFAATAEQVPQRLHAADVVRLDSDGRVEVAYPFSASPTRHRVRLPGQVEVFAMCVIDALGIPAMLGTDAVISTTDPANGAPITATATDEQITWEPPNAVVFVGARPWSGPSADTCCDYLNAFTDQHHADLWMRSHPETPGEILAPIDAQLLGRRIFGDLLTRGGG